MTTEIVITNREGIAMAADSTQTITSESGPEKTYPYGNKLFAVSYNHPIGIMVYNNSSYYGTPWETLIKFHRKEIANKKYNRLREYVDDFIAFIEKQSIPIEIQKSVTYSSFLTFHIIIKKDIGSLFGTEYEITEELIVRYFNNVLENLQENTTHKNINDDKFIEEIMNERDVIQDLIQIYGIELYKNYTKFIEEINKLYFERMAHVSTGIVIAGYGEEESLPTIFEINISECRNNRLVYSLKEDTDTEGCVYTFAQCEMVETFLYGVSQNFVDETTRIIKNNCSSESEQKAITNQIQNIAKSNFNKTAEVISILQKPQMATMAETLVNMTSFRKTISLDMETVGGPVDVAVISKTEGFIWIKRKQYFDISLNPHFNSRYYKSIQERET